MISGQIIPGVLDCRDDSIADLESALSADRHGIIRAVVVDPAVTDVTRAVVERCWHDAVVIAEESQRVFDRAA